MSCTHACAQKALETTVDVYYELQIFIDKFRQNRLGARDAALVWVTVYVERLVFLCCLLGNLPGSSGRGIFPST